MPRWWIAAIGLAALVLGAPAAHAVLRPFEGTLTLDFPGFQTCLDPPPPNEGACGWPLAISDTQSFVADVVLTPGGNIESLAMPAGIFVVGGTQYFYDTVGNLFPMNSVALDVGHGAGALGPTGGAMPLAGSMKICLYGACGASYNVANLSVPLSVVGSGGTSTAMNGPITITAFGTPWTAGTISIGMPPVQVHGSAAPGRLQLVTPIYVNTNIGAFATLNIAYARLTLELVPEPTTAILLGLGTLALAALGRTPRG